MKEVGVVILDVMKTGLAIVFLADPAHPRKHLHPQMKERTLNRNPHNYAM